MNSKYTKKLLFFLVILAFSLAIAGIVFPIYTMSSDDLDNAAGNSEENRLWVWFFEYKILYARLEVTDYTLCIIGEPPDYIDQYYIFWVIPVNFASRDHGMHSLYFFQVIKDRVEPLDFENFIGTVFFVISLLFGFFYAGFSLMSLIYLNKKKTRAPLFTGMAGIVFVLCIVIGAYLMFSAQGLYLEVIERQKYMRLGLGFYYMLASSILFIIVYFLQKKFYITDEKGNVIGFKEKINIKSN